MAQAYWKIVEEVNQPGSTLYLQKGEYHFFAPGKPPEPGYRFIWRVAGKQQARPARIDDLATIDALLVLGRARGWSP